MVEIRIGIGINGYHATRILPQLNGVDAEQQKRGMGKNGSLKRSIFKQFDKPMVSWSEFDLNAFRARVKDSNERLEILEGCENEAELHGQIARECLRRGWLAFHGSMAHKTFRNEGEPDFVILCDSGKVLLVECKTRKGKLSLEQQAIHAWANRLSHEVHTVRSMDEFLRIANQVTKPPHDSSTDGGIQGVLPGSD